MPDIYCAKKNTRINLNIKYESLRNCWVGSIDVETIKILFSIKIRNTYLMLISSQKHRDPATYERL